MEVEPNLSPEEKKTGTPVPVSGKGGEGAQGVATTDLTNAAELARFDVPFPYAVLLTKTSSLHVKSLVATNKKLPKDRTYFQLVFHLYIILL